MRRLILIAVIVLLAGCDSLDSDINTAERTVRDSLKDGDSAKFRNVQKCPTDWFVTGEVNAKNGYGAYSGFRKFYANFAVAYFQESSETENWKEYARTEEWKEHGRMCNDPAYVEGVRRAIEKEIHTPKRGTPSP